MKLRYLAALSLLLCSQFVLSEENKDGITEWLKYDNSTLPPAVEDPFTLPDLAKLKDWYVYPMGRNMRFAQVAIAADSVQTGKDEIIRYAVAVTAKSGVRSVYFEGLDCNTARYRLYAVGTSARDWAEVDKVIWKPGQIQLLNVWQGQLLKDFCGVSAITEKSAESIISQIKKGQLESKSAK